MTRILRLVRAVSKAASVAMVGAGSALIVSRFAGDEGSRFLKMPSLLADTSVLDSHFSRNTVPWDFNWDKLDPNQLVRPLKPDAKEEEVQARQKKVQDKTSKARRTLIFVRHGQYELDGTNDEQRILTSLGKDQAHLTGVRLATLVAALTKKDQNNNECPDEQLPRDVDVSLTMSSMKRATETANIIMEHLPDYVKAQSCDLIREGNPCETEPPLFLSAQSCQVDGARIEAGFRKHVHRAYADQEKDSVEIFVCHGNVIRYFVCRALQLPPEAWIRFSLRNGSYTVMTISPAGHVSVTNLGDSAHMPPDKLTFN